MPTPTVRSVCRLHLHPLREVVHRVSSSLLGLVDPLLRALSGSLKFTVRRYKFNKDSSLAHSLLIRDGAEAHRYWDLPPILPESNLVSRPL